MPCNVPCALMPCDSKKSGGKSPFLVSIFEKTLASVGHLLLIENASISCQSNVEVAI